MLLQTTLQVTQATGKSGSFPGWAIGEIQKNPAFKRSCRVLVPKAYPRT